MINYITNIKNKTKSLQMTILIGVDILLFLFILSMIIPSENYLTVVAIIVTIFIGLIPLYLDVYKIKNAIITPVSLSSRLDPINDKIAVFSDEYSYETIKSPGIKKILNSSGYLRELRVLGGVLGEVTIYDGDEISGTEIVPTVVPNKGQVLKKDCAFYTGLTVVTKTATIIVISYRSGM